jgi:hypothetical protein
MASVVPYRGRMLILPSGQVMYTAHSTTVDLYTPDLTPDPVWRPTITSVPSSIRRGRTFRLSGRQLNGVTQGSYYGNDATQATNYPIVRLESNSSSAVFYCRTSNFSTMGLQTGTVIHGCDVFVPSLVPTGSYCLRVIANGISTAACSNVAVTTKWFKELKYEIKEKLEIIEDIKRITDINVKRVPDFDLKGIREDMNIIERIDEEWKRTIQTVASAVDQTNAELARSFIVPDERPAVGPPEPEIEELNVRKISEAEAHAFQEKEGFADGDDRQLTISDEASDLHEVIHNLWRSGGKLDLRDQKAVSEEARRLRRGAGTASKSAKKKASSKKASKKKASKKKATAKKSSKKKTSRRRG